MTLLIKLISGLTADTYASSRSFISGVLFTQPFGGYQKLGTQVHAFNEDDKNFKGATYICKYKQLSDSGEGPNSWCEGERDWGMGEVIFLEVTEFDPGFKGWLTRIWRKGSGEGPRWGGGIHPFLHSANLFGTSAIRHCSLSGDRVERRVFGLMECTFWWEKTEEH